MTGIIIENVRSAYSPEDIERKTMTVSDLISCLEEMSEAYGEDARVFISNDNGYTYSAITWESVDTCNY